MNEKSPNGQEKMFNYGVELAHEANAARDAGIASTQELVSIDEQNRVSSHRVAPEVRRTVAKRAMEHFSHYEKYDNAVGALIGPGVNGEAQSTIETNPFATPEVWSAMTPEQQQFATEARPAIAKGPLAEYGVTQESLRVVSYQTDDGEQHFALTHIGPGIEIGNPTEDYDPARSYRAVMSPENDKLFQFELNGVTYDTRRGMTDPVYAAKVEDAHSRGVTLPDSQELAEETGDVWTGTILTGEGLTAVGGVPVRDVSGGRVGRRNFPPGGVRRTLRVCPAVEII